MLIQCVIIDDEPIARDVIRDYLSKISGFIVVAEFNNPIAALLYLNENSVDVIFLDINIPEINGIEFAKSLINPPSIIFTTAYREYAPEGFEIHAIDYLVKPISFERFIKAINHYLKIATKTSIKPTAEKELASEDDSIFLKDSGKIHKIHLNEIMYIESDGDYLKFYTKEKKVMVRGSLKSWEKSLPERQFIRIHNSYIVAINAIKSFTTYAVDLGGIELPISRGYREKVLLALNW
jgi:DNA-binding LytR/AlgR family response regulator